MSTTTEIVVGSPSGETDSVARGDLVADAKRRFTQTVATAVGELTRRFGYSRSHATSLLLAEIRLEEEVSLNDDEVYSVMRSHGLGMEEAAKTVTVARALRRLRMEQRLSAAEAIDDLTNRLKMSALLGKMEEEEEKRGVDWKSSETLSLTSSPRIRPCGGRDDEKNRMLGEWQGTPRLERKCRRKKTKPVQQPKKAVAPRNLAGSRKRPLNEEEPKSAAARPETEEKQKMKRLRVEEDGYALETTKIKVSACPAVRTKRNLSLRPDEASPPPSQQPCKRSRQTAEL